MTAWVNGRRTGRLDVRDRGLHYGDGLFETLRVRHRQARLLDAHLARLQEGCRRLRIAPPDLRRLRGEIERAAALRADGVLKLMVTRGIGPRGYRPCGDERTTRVLSLHPLPASARSSAAVNVRVCATTLGQNPRLAGLKTLNRLESVLARAEWQDARIWEGLLLDTEGHVVCATMCNVFMRRGAFLLTPMLDRCGVAGVMRRWVLEQADTLGLRAMEGRLRLADLEQAEEVFLTNAVAGIVSVGVVRHGRARIRPAARTVATQLRARLERL